MNIKKRYKGEDNWEPISLEKTLDYTEGRGYWEKGSVKNILLQGGVVWTPVAIYRDFDSCKKEGEQQ